MNLPMCCFYLFVLRLFEKTEKFENKTENIPLDHQMIDHQMRHANCPGSKFLTVSIVILKVDVTRSHSRTHSPMTLTSFTSLTHPITSLTHSITNSITHSITSRTVTHAQSPTVTHADPFTQSCTNALMITHY